MKSPCRLFILLVLIFFLQGCSVYMAANQPEKKDIELLKVGNHRDLLLAEYGEPSFSENRNGKKVDIFSFEQGYSKGNKAGRVFFHGAADVLTLGLWEVVGTPAELYFDGDELIYRVFYNEEDIVDEVVLLKRKE